jgi:hypothetical protein
MGVFLRPNILQAPLTVLSVWPFLTLLVLSAAAAAPALFLLLRSRQLWLRVRVCV